MFSKTTLLMAFQAGLALAGNAILTNRCDEDVYVWSVGPGRNSGLIKVPARDQHTEPLYNVGTSLKLSSSTELLNGHHTQFEYSLAGGKLWYDISFVNCAQGETASSCPGHVDGLKMYGSNSECGTADCAAGSYCPSESYYVDQPLIKLGLKEPVFSCPLSLGSNIDLHMVVCTNKPSLKRSIAGRVAVDLEG
ncbi:bys1 domain-containing protein [Stemphylium lycopersici]|uniref:Bys1 domain-containing protein n=1 Tax=Stemphylium lycopersici TaxID=183478 RepID=A0A364N4G3_STELY|nr:bys1 domain-containing protein [Stemphylium lycopersici]RAR02441.1 bys1 domain-containing protein [Stemphylium lycopersici]RAR11482.1 bys1 domain-containing protein [Stemphylium lycopersici]